MGQGSSSSSTAYDKLIKHREALYNRQLDYHRQCETVRRQGAEQLRVGNKVGAVTLAKQLKALQAQSSTIAGMINSLDSHKASLEAHQYTQESMNVIAACVKNVGKNALSVAAADNLADASLDMQEDLREISEALGMPAEATDDDEVLLGMLAEPEEMENSVQKGGGAGQDQVFLEWLREEACGAVKGKTIGVVKLPDVPTHQLPKISDSKLKRERAQSFFVM